MGNRGLNESNRPGAAIPYSTTCCKAVVRAASAISPTSSAYRPRVEFAKSELDPGRPHRHPQAAGQSFTRKALPLMTVPASVSM
jgi:hypothetical protein